MMFITQLQLDGCGQREHAALDLQRAALPVVPLKERGKLEVGGAAQYECK